MTAWKGDRPLEVLTLGMGEEIFALEASCVREILDPVPVTEVPGSEMSVNGLINVRGKVVPLADLRPKFGMEQEPATIDTRIVVIETPVDGCPAIVGIRADKVFEITGIAAADLEEAPSIGMRWRPDYILCIGKRGADFIVVLDIGRIFGGPRDEAAGACRQMPQHAAA
jgi:purine-binding chemotaxis protein CheW